MHKEISRNVFSMVLLAVVGAGVVGMAHVAEVFALTYQSDTDLSFTFNPTLSISLSDTNINIDNLLPGLSSESSPITVSVNSNTPYGYSLFASIGNSTDYNTTNLIHEDSSIGNNAIFTSIATNASLPELTTDNTWGYTYRTHNTNNTDNEGWSNYNGLPLYSTVDNNTSTNNPALLIDTKNPADSTESIDFKIAAKASSTQASGTYNNVINFYAVGKPAPVYMQDTATIKATLVDVGDEMQAIDERDGKTYWIAKFADGNIWMTQNLDLDLDNQTALTPANTNISANWTPVNSTIAFEDTSVSGWSNNNNVPYSADPGDVYYYSSGTTNNDEQYTSLADCRAAHPDCSMKNHAGNYYNWSAAVADNDTSSVTSQYGNAPGSICPIGWRLPTGRDSNNTAVSREWNALLVAEGIMANSTGNGYAAGGFNKIRIAPLWLARSGSVGGGSLYGAGGSGSYWSSTVSDGNNAYYLYFYSSDVYPVGSSNRYIGYSVRCVAQ